MTRLEKLIEENKYVDNFSGATESEIESPDCDGFLSSWQFDSAYLKWTSQTGEMTGISIDGLIKINDWLTKMLEEE